MDNRDSDEIQITAVIKEENKDYEHAEILKIIGSEQVQIAEYENNGNPPNDGSNKSKKRVRVRVKKEKKVSGRQPKTIVLSDTDIVFEDEDLPYSVKLSSSRRIFCCRKCTISNSRLSCIMKHINKDHNDSSFLYRDDIKFRCNECKRLFSKHSAFFRHRMSHIDPLHRKRHVCNTCGECFEYKSMVKRHVLMRHSTVTPYHCKKCNRYFGQKSHMNRHMKTHCTKPIFTCKYCNLTFKAVFNLNCHIGKIHGKKLYKCHLCVKEYCLKHQLIKHLTNHPGKSNCLLYQKCELKPHSLLHKSILVVCEICSTLQISRSSLLQHIKNVHINNNENCHLNKINVEQPTTENVKRSEITQELVSYIKIEPTDEEKDPEITTLSQTSIKIESELKAEENMETFTELELNTKPKQIELREDHLSYNIKNKNIEFTKIESKEIYGNIICSDEKQPNDINSHCQVENNKEEILKYLNKVKRPHKCVHCSQAFESKKSLRKHSSLHKKILECQSCKLSFQYLRELDRHMLNVHEKKLNCNFCQKEFITRKGLNAHVNIHTKKTPYPCEKCNKVFWHWNVLDAHRLTHNPLKKHVCNYCEMPFATKRNLQGHLNKHENKRLVKCKHCEKHFFTKSVLRSHILRNHTDIKPFACDFCEHQYASMYLLKRHMSTHTRNNILYCLACKKRYTSKIKYQNHLGKNILCQKEFLKKK